MRGMVKKLDEGIYTLEPNRLDPDHRAGVVGELRAILAPLLDDPYDDEGGFISDRRCRFCWATSTWKKRPTGRRDARGRNVREWADATPHKADCPVLRKDTLLGR